MKFLGAVNVLAASIVLLSVVVIANANNITFGVVGPYDRFVAIQNLIKSSSWFGTQTVDVIYPPKGHISYVILKAIKVYDHGGPKNFGFVSLIKGGPGHRNATLRFKSQSRKSMNFTIHYFGY